MTNKLRLRNLANFSFDENNHIYELGGKLLTGVTTILSVRAQDYLKWWTVKEMYNFLLPKLSEVQNITDKQWEAILLEGKKAHTIKSKTALISGGLAHNWIEQYIKNKKPSLPEDEKAKQSIKRFLEWEKSNKVIWLASELKLPSINHLFAGMIDAVAVINKILTLVDFKTSSRISEDCYLQTAGYYILLDENLLESEERPKQRLILRIPKDGTDFETQIVKTPLEFDIKTFLALREIHRWNIYIKNRIKVAK